MKLVLATHNKHKTKEFKRILETLGCDIDILTLDEIGFVGEIVEDGTSFEENAMIKARCAAKLGYIGIADDSGLCVDALGGAPGIYSARYAGETCDDKANNDKLLYELREVADKDRGAQFVCAIACAFPDGKNDFTVKADTEGFITHSEEGEGGFGYDPLFFCEKFGKTFASLTPDEKNSLSHRGRAIKLFAEKFAEIMTEKYN